MIRGERGFALVITLVVSALLVALVTEFVNEVYVDTSARQNFVDAQQASLLAESGINGGIKLLQLFVAGRKYNSLSDPWAKPIELADEQGTLEVTIEDESAKLNLNMVALPKGDMHPVYHPIATRLLKKLELSPDLCDSLGDWRDEREEPNPAGAETAYYSTLQAPYAAKNALLDTLDELRLVKGFDAKTMERLLPFVTVFAEDRTGTAAPININTAPAEVLAAISNNMSDDLVERIIDYRKTTPFQKPGDLNNVTGMDSITLTLPSGLVQTNSNIYRLVSRGRVKETSRVIEAVVNIGGSPPTLYWREY
ncbi:MAG: proteinral secretion pathway protein [Geobacteraceae bacterium]|nr:MAG: proteinral secretion pathway protein [Geobacteraceae bacterium]